MIYIGSAAVYVYSEKIVEIDLAINRVKASRLKLVKHYRHEAISLTNNRLKNYFLLITQRFALTFSAGSSAD